MSEDERLKILDDKFLETEQLKDLIISEVMKMNESLQEEVEKLGAADPKKLEATLKSLTSFLKSSTGLMQQLNVQIREITSEVMKMKAMLDQVGLIYSRK